MMKASLIFTCLFVSASVAFSGPNYEEQNEAEEQDIAYVCSQYLVGITHLGINLLPITFFKVEGSRILIEGEGATRKAAEIELSKNRKRVYNDCLAELQEAVHITGECKITKMKCRKYGEESDEELEE